jgi:hypothetical protein
MSDKVLPDGGHEFYEHHTMQAPTAGVKYVHVDDHQLMPEPWDINVGAARQVPASGGLLCVIMSPLRPPFTMTAGQEESITDARDTQG